MRFHRHKWVVTAEYKDAHYHDEKLRCEKCGESRYEHWFVLGVAEANKEALDELEKKAKK